MNITISFGWWAVPATVTLAAFMAATFLASRGGERYSGTDYFGMGALFDAIVWLFWIGAAAIVSLIAWLVWAVLT